MSEDGKLFLFMKAPVDAKQIWEQDEASAAENANNSLSVELGLSVTLSHSCSVSVSQYST